MSEQTLKVGDIIYSHGTLRPAKVEKVTARQIKLREQGWRPEDGFTGWLHTRPMDELGHVWFLTLDDAVVATYRSKVHHAIRKQADADAARESKRQFREKYASALTGVEG